MLRVSGYSFAYALTGKKALDRVDLTASSGEHMLIMGATGAGKTTLCCALRGLLGSFLEGETSGEIEVAGITLDPRPPHAVARLASSVGLVFQDFERQLFSTNVVKEIAFGPENLNLPAHEVRERVEWALHLVGLEGHQGRSPRTLSGGEKQRLAIASVLAMRPRVLLLDEPTTDLDPVGKDEIFGLRERLAGAVELLVMVEHEIEPALAFEKIVLLASGRVAAAGDREMLRDDELFEANAAQPWEPAVVARVLGLPGFTTEVLRRGLSPVVPPPPPPPLVSPAREAVVLRGVRFGYGDAAPVLDHFSLEVGEGEFVAILGPNGCGKTTAAKLMAGLLRPSEGRVEIMGRDAAAIDFRGVGAEVGYVFQNPDHQIFSTTIADEIAFGPRNMGLGVEQVSERVGEVMRITGLAGLEQVDPFTLPKGFRQMVAVASVLAMRPRILILDEPTTGLDLAGQRAIMGLLGRLNREGHTVIIITHSMRAAIQHATRTIVMKNGTIHADGRTEDVFYEGDLAAAALRPPPIVELGRMAGVRARSVEDLLRAVRGVV